MKPWMTAGRFLRPTGVCLCAILLFAAGCNQKRHGAQPDRPRLTPSVTMQDITFHSAALSREMRYRVVLPAGIAVGNKVPVVYLLHGGYGNFRDWSNYSDVSRYAERGLILVMPEGGDSYYVNARQPPQDRYEDYIVSDLIADVENRFQRRRDAAHAQSSESRWVGTGRSNSRSAILIYLFSLEGSVPQSMFPAVRSRSKGFNGRVTIMRFLETGEP